MSCKEELQFHLEREAGKYSAGGASPNEAMRRARIALEAWNWYASSAAMRGV